MKAKPPAKKRVDDPLEILLKEKKLAENSGKGTEALRRAETAVARSNAMGSEWDSDREHPRSAKRGHDWTNEAAAMNAVRERQDLDFGSGTSLFGSPRSASDSFPEAEDQERLLGFERGKAVSILLAGDMQRKAHVRAEGKMSGVLLWLEDREMDSQTVLPSEKPPQPTLAGATVHPIIKAVNIAVERGGMPT